MGNPGLPVGLPCTRTAPERRRKIAYCSSWSTSKPMPSRWCKDAYSGWARDKANQWIHVLLPALLAALRILGDAPARSLTTLAQRLGVSEADAATVVAPREEAPVPLTAAPTGEPVSPLLPMTGPNGVSSAPKTLLNRPSVRAARQRTTRSKM